MSERENGALEEPVAAEPAAEAPAPGDNEQGDAANSSMAERLRPRLTEEERAAIKAEKEKEKQEKELLLELPKTPTPDLKALVVAGICKPTKDCLSVRCQGKQATADLLVDGSVLYRGKTYASLSPFSKDAHNDLRKELGLAARMAYNGWSSVYYLVRAPDDWVVITQLREQLYAIEAQQEAEAHAKAEAEAIENAKEAARREAEELAAANRGTTAGGKELADRVSALLDSALSERTVKAAFLRRDKKALLDAAMEAASPPLLELLTEFRRGSQAQMKALCKEVEALLLGAMRPAVAETLGDDQANLDDLAEEVLDRCKETLLPFCDELKTRPNESFAPNEPNGAGGPGNAAAAGGRAGKPAAEGRKPPPAGVGQRAAAAAGRARMAEAERKFAELSDEEGRFEEEEEKSSSESSDDDDDSDSGRKKKKKKVTKKKAAGEAAAGGNKKRKGSSGGAGGGAKKKSRKRGSDSD